MLNYTSFYTTNTYNKVLRKAADTIFNLAPPRAASGRAGQDHGYDDDDDDEDDDDDDVVDDDDDDYYYYAC